ncbi:protein daughterless [Caerostris extrusa]|uniref:Protein daughterless n=1 Tax=Caerostris extrusa TaxID=172846 RepID=A0AAV4Y185_CAEEX|nr:protein daughterless [Caerostris extrusa]
MIKTNGTYFGDSSSLLTDICGGHERTKGGERHRERTLVRKLIRTPAPPSSFFALVNLANTMAPAQIANEFIMLEENYVAESYERNSPTYPSVSKTVPFVDPYYLNEDVPDTWSSSNNSLNSPNFNFQSSNMPNPPVLNHINQGYPSGYLPSHLPCNKADQTNSSFSSTPSTPISSPPPLASLHQNWPRGSSQFNTQPVAPYTELTSTVNTNGITDDRLTEALNVMKTVAEGPSLLQMQNAVPMGSSPPNANSLHSSLVQKNLPPALESFSGALPAMQMPPNGLMETRRTIIGVSNPPVPITQSFDLPCLQGHEQLSVLSPGSSVNHTPSNNNTVSKKPQSRGYKRARSK